MSAQAMTINEVEWRSAEVKARSGRILSTAYQHAKISVLHINVLSNLGGLADDMGKLITFLHAPEPSAILEATSPEARGKVGANLRDAADKVQMLLARLRTTDFGYWKRFYHAKIEALDRVNQEICAHGRAFMNPSAELIMLGKEDQEFLLKAIYTPEEWREELEALGRK